MARSINRQQQSRTSKASQECYSRSTHRCWLSIDGFLSLKAPKTRETYSGVLHEWCAFLGAEYGSGDAAARLVQAQDLHALAFRAWLEKRPGERPRSERRESSSRELTTHLPRFTQKRSGLEATLSNATIAKKFAVLHRIYRMLQGADVGV
ncbi:MAG: hypothetical protein EBZ48_17865, partial [Proteobacteria bacterium]|nr:hypothetical protein [Pseudomonadota bacterium]